MSEHLHNDIDKLFLDSLQPHQDEPAEHVWEKIEAQLDEEDALKHKVWMRIMFRTAACIFALAIALEIPSKLHRNGNPESEVTLKNVQESVLSREKAGNSSSPQNRVAILTDYKNKSTISRNNSNGQAINRNAETISLGAGNSFNTLVPPVIQSKQEYPFSGGLHFISLQSPVSQVASPQIDMDQIGSALENQAQVIIKRGLYSLRHRLSVTPYFSQEFVGYNLSDDDATIADGSEIEKKERTVFSASGGILLNYRWKRRWVIQSGLSYSWSSSIIDSSKSYAVKVDNSNVQFRINTISGYGYLPSHSSIAPNVGDSVLTDKAYSKLHYLTIPLITNYEFKRKRFSLLVGAGVTINFLTGATLETKIYSSSFSQNEPVVAMNGLKKINYGILLKAELNYRINSKFGIDLIPCFKNTLSPINIHSALSTYPYNFGIGLGIRYQL